MASDPERAIWFWRHGKDGGGEIHFSSHPHPKLPFYCKRHKWYSSEKCDAHGRAPRKS